MDANRLRRLAALVDREHRAAMSDAADAAERSLGRRQLVRGLGGLAVTVAGVGVGIPALASAARAQQSTTTVAGQGGTTGTTVSGVTTTGAQTTTTAGPATTTTTLPPSKPQPSDLVFLAFVQSLELALVQTYGLALASTLLSEDVATVARAFQSHHRDHAQAFAGLAGKAATGVANQSIVSAFGPQFQSATSEQQLLTAAFSVETMAAATYTAGLAKLLGTDPAYLMASILPIESRHAVVLGEALQLDIDEYAPVFETTQGAATPEQYPMVER